MKHLQMLWTAALTLAILTDPSLAHGSSSVFCSTPNAEPFYALVVDGGTTGSRMRVFTWEGNDREGPVIEVIPNATIKDAFKFKNKEGLSSFAPTGVGAGASLGPLVEAAKMLVPEDARARTPLYVLGTGGVRALESESVQLAVLDDTHEYLTNSTNSPFSLQKVTALPGESEGLGLYVTLNEGTETQLEEWKGVLDMGGSSLQYVFSPKILLGNGQSFLLNDSVVQVFSDSYDRFGKDKMRDLYLNNVVATGTESDPGNYLADCFPPDYTDTFTTKDGKAVTITGTGDGLACETAIDALLQLDESCNLPPCGLMGRYVPKVNNDIEYVAISSFYYAAYDLGLFDGDSGDSTAEAMRDAAISYCGENLGGVSSPYARTRCFDALYCARVLSAIGLGDREITFQKKLDDGGSLDFTRGALFIDRAAALLSCEPEACEVETTCLETRDAQYHRKNDKIGLCRQLAKRTKEAVARVCSKNKSSSTGLGPAKDMCRITCNTCPNDSCNELFSNTFSFLQNEDSVEQNCHWLQNRQSLGKNIDKICRSVAEGYFAQSAAESCPVTCGTCDNLLPDLD